MLEITGINVHTKLKYVNQREMTGSKYTGLGLACVLEHLSNIEQGFRAHAIYTIIQYIYSLFFKEQGLTIKND